MSFLVEFAVAGDPVSLQTRNKAAKTAWKAQVSKASEAGYPLREAPFDGPLTVTIYYFPAAAMQGDIDNIVKPILDSLCNRVYVDDGVVATVVVRKIEPGQAIVLDSPSSTLLDVLVGEKPIVYLRISDDPMSVSL